MFGQVKGQEQERRPETFVDRHGREYYANVELKTGDPCEILQPQGWTAPQGPSWFRGMLMPPLDDMKIVRMVPRLLRAKKRYQIEIDYDAWLDQLDQRNEEYDARLHDLAKGMTGGIAALEIAKNPPPALLHYIGPRPFPPRVFVEAMKAGNDWALGLSDEIPQKALALLAELEPLVTKRKRNRDERNAIDPLADEFDEVYEDELEAEDDPFSEQATDIDLDDDKLFDLEDEVDPEARGGKIEPVSVGATGGRKRKKDK